MWTLPRGRCWNKGSFSNPGLIFGWRRPTPTCGQSVVTLLDQDSDKPSRWVVTLWLVTLPRGCLRSPLLWGAGGRAAQEPGIWHDQPTPYRMGKTLCTPYTSNSLLAIYRIIQNLPGCETIGTSTSTRINSRPSWPPVLQLFLVLEVEKVWEEDSTDLDCCTIW